jgi:sugar phosphate isomerase/epimerase
VHTYLRLAERFHSPILRVVVDTGHHRPTEDELVGTITGLVPSFERKGIVLAIENHDRFTTRVLARTLERIDSAYVGICLDTVNSLGALEGPEAVIDALGPWVVNLHVKDLAIYRPIYGMGFTIEGRPAGQGRLDIPRLLERMGALNRDLSAILELWTPPERSLAETVAKESAWATASVAYLRQLIPA